MIIITFDVLEHNKKIGENHNFVGTIGNTIYKEWGSSLNATGYDLIIHGMADIVNYRFFRS
jgi:hypothetical protein